MATAAAAAAEIQETLSSTETAILMERIVSDFTMEEFNKSNGAGDLDCLQKPIEHLEEQREGESFFQSPSLAAEKTGSAVIQEEKTMVRQEDSLQTKETEDKSVDDIVISEDGEQEQCHPSIQHLEENETVEDKETTCIDDLEAEESTEAVGLPESVSMEKGNEVTQIGDEGKEPAAALDTDGYVSGGEHGEDIQKEELSSVEVNSSVEIAEPTVPSDALDTVSIPPLPLELVESSSSMVVSEIETREALEEALESNSYLNEAKESPTIGDATDETMLDGSEACEVLESGVKEKECLEEASIIQVDENEEVHSGNQEKEIETMEVVSSEIEAPEIHMKSEDTEGKDTIVEPEKESATIVSEKDYICDDIPNEEVNDEQGSVDTSGEVKEEVLEEVVHVKEIHEERASIPETEDLTTIVEKKDATVESEGTEKLELSSAAGLKEVRLEKEELQKPNDFEVEEKKPEHEDEALASHVQECNTYETEFILNENAAQELSLTLIQDEEHAESRAVEKVREDTESTKEPREIGIADDPSIEEGHASVQDAEQLSVEVNDANAEVVLEEHALIEKVNQTGNGDKEIADRKAEELNSKEDFKVAKEEVEKPEIVVTEISSVTMEREVKVESEVNEEVLQPKETEDKSIDAIVIMEDEEKEQGHPLIQQAEGLMVSVEDAKPEESKDDEEIETVEDKETICKDVLEAEESTEVVLAEYASMEKENDVNQIGDGDMEPTAALDVSGGDQGGFLEDITKEELSSSAELQKSNGYQVEETSTAYTEQTEVNSSVEIAETSVPSDAAEVSTPLVPLQFVESSSSVVVSESETREAVEEELESNSYLNEVKETPTTGDATDETMLDGSEACEVPESGVKAKEYLDEASYIQVEVKGKAQDGNEEAKSSETTEVVSSEIELPEIHIKSEDAEGKDKTVEPEEQPATIDAAKDYIRDDISNEEVSVDTSGEGKEQVTEESASIPETEDLTTIVEKKDATVESEETENLELSSAVVLKEVCLEKEELHKPIDFEVEEKKPEHEDECNTYENEFILNESATQERQSASEQVQGVEIQYVGIVNENAEEETEDKSKLSSVVNEEETPIMVKQEDILLPKETDDKSMKADAICEVGGEEQLSLTLIQDEEHAESRAVEKVREDTEATKEPREISIADDPSIEEGHASVEEAEQLSVEVKDANAEVVLEDHALIEKVNQTGDGDKEIADRKAEELNSKEDFKVSKEEVEKPETVVTEIRSVTIEGEVKVESEVKGSALEKDSIVEENAEEENKNKSKLSAVNEEVLQPKETEDKSIDAIVIMEDEVKEQGHQSIQQAEGLTISVEDAKPEESKDDEENETVEDKETTCKDVLEAEESTEVVLAEYASMEKENDVNQIGDGDTEPTAALDVSGGDQRGFLEDIQKEELSSSAELQKSNGYTEQTEVNSSVEIAEPSVSTDAAEVSTPLVPLQLVESSSSVVVSESETREAVEEALESNSYLNEAKETPTIGDAADETTLACEVPESGVEAKECLEEASIIQVDENEEVHSGNQEKEIETMEVVSSEIRDTEGKDQIVEPEKEPSTIVSEKDYICDDIPNEEVNDEQGSVDTSGEVKEQVIEEVVHVKEIHEERASIPEIEKLELSSTAVLKEVCLEKEELQKPIDFEVEENKSEDEDSDLASHVQECNTYENELILNENATQERQSASEQAQGGEIQYVCIVNENAEEETEDKSKLSVVNEEETPMVRQDDILQTKEMDDKSMNAADVICEDGGEEQLSLALIQDEEHTESQAVEMEAEIASFELLEKVREDTEAIKEPREIAIIEEGHSSIQEAEQLSVEVNDANAEKDSIVEENAEEENQNKFKLSAVNEEVLQPKETEDNSIDAIVIMEDEENEQGHPSIQHPEENETIEDKETTCKDVLEAEESTEVALVEYASMEKENDVNQIGDGDKEATAYVVVAESETREAVEEGVESNSYLNEAKETPTIGDAADETTPGYEVPESGVEAKECLEEASIIQVDENEEVHSGNQEKEVETMEVLSSEIRDTEGKDQIVEPEKEPSTIVSEKDYICDDIPNEEVNDEQGSAESIIESTSIAESIIEKDVIVESEETEKETEENNTMEIERSKMQMQDSSSIPPQTEEVIMEENASYNKIGNEESVEVLREQTTTEEPPLSESVQESEAVSKETLILDTQHEFEELEKQPKSTDDSVYDLISNEGVNDEQQASVETTEEIEDQVVEKQNMSDEIELGDAEEIQQTPDEHVAERSCEIEMQVIKEDISIEDGKDGERDIDESDSKLEDGAEKSVNEVNKGSDSELVPDQYIEATGESESSAVKQQETVEKTEVENELIKIESSNIEEISVADVKEETPIEEEADSEEQGERDSGSWEDTSENESSTGKLEEKVVTEVEEISCPAEKVELANEAQPDTESKETEVSSHVTFETIKEETETKESISEAEDYENGDLKIQDDAEKQHESVNEKIEPLQDGISHAEADNGYEAVESETNEVSFVIEASEQEISSVEEKGTLSGDYIETEDITECIREGDDETQEPATKSESSTAELHKEEDMSSILQDKAAEEHAKEETAEEIESPGFASSVTLETGALTSEVNHEFVDSEAKNLNLEEIKNLDVTEEKKDTVSGECKEAGDTSTCVTEGVDENEIKEAEIDSTVTIESTEITSEETEAKKEEADSEPENCGLVEAEGPVSGEYKEAEEDSSETAGEVAEASEATEGVKFTEEEEKGENEATKQFIGEDVDAAKENYETVTEVSKVLTPTVHSEDIESSKEVAEEEDTSYVKSVAVDEVEAKLSDVVTENGSELHPPREEAEGEGGLQDCASKEAVISDGGTQIVFDDGKITPEVKAEAFTTGVVEKNIDTSYVVVDAEVRDSKSQIIDGKGFDETSLDAATDKAADLSLSDLLHEARDQNLEVPMPLTEEKDMVGSTSELHNEETDAHEAKTDEEAEEVMVESCKEIDVKTPKKHSNILSGVSSKVKHSISKVKKAITGKSSNSKTKVSKTNEALPDS